MFANTITITDGAASKILARVNQDKYSSEYALKEALQSYKVLIQHSRTIKLGVETDRVRVFFLKIVNPTLTAPAYKYESSISFPFVQGNDPIATRDLVRANIGLNTTAFVDALVQGEN